MNALRCRYDDRKTSNHGDDQHQHNKDLIPVEEELRIGGVLQVVKTLLERNGWCLERIRVQKLGPYKVRATVRETLLQDSTREMLRRKTEAYKARFHWNN